MDLGDYLDKTIGEDPAADLSDVGPLTSRLTTTVSDQRIAALPPARGLAPPQRNTASDRHAATSLIASTFWQSYLFSGGLEIGHEFLQSVYRFRNGKWPQPALPQAYIVRHGDDWRPRHDLLIIDPKARHQSMQPARAPDAKLRDGWSQFRTRAGLNRFMGNKGPLGEIAREGMVLAIEAQTAGDFRVLIAPPAGHGRSPDAEGGAMAATSAFVPQSALASANDFQGTVGVLAWNARGSPGATIAAHTLKRTATHASIANRMCEVIGRDDVTDSCFVGVDPKLLLTTPVSGPLRGALPAHGEGVSFDGVASGHVDTKVNGWTPELPFTVPECQSRILTKPVTSPGDSGAALRSQSGHVVGFAFMRSGFDHPIEFSAWIWAESVFAAHGLQ